MLGAEGVEKCMELFFSHTRQIIIASALMGIVFLCIGWCVYEFLKARGLVVPVISWVISGISFLICGYNCSKYTHD